MKDIFSDLVHWAWQKFRYDFDSQRQDAAEWYNVLVTRYAPIMTDGELQGMLPAKRGVAADLYSTKHIMVLTVIEQGDVILPFLTMNYDFAPDDGKVWIHIGLLCNASKDEASPHDAQYSFKFRSIGFRIEPPEESGATARSNHDYYHVQPLRSIRRQEDHLPLCPVWFPDQWPTWPIHARDPVQAFLSALVGLYGLRALRILLAENAMQRETRDAVADYAQLISQKSFPKATPFGPGAGKRRK